jgi:hypothetical protein
LVSPISVEDPVCRHHKKAQLTQNDPDATVR